MKFHRISFTKVTGRATKTFNYHLEGMKKFMVSKLVSQRSKEAAPSSDQRETQGHFYPLTAPPPPPIPARFWSLAAQTALLAEVSSQALPGWLLCLSQSLQNLWSHLPQLLLWIYWPWCQNNEAGVVCAATDSIISHNIRSEKMAAGFLMVCQKSLVDNNSFTGFPGNYSCLLCSNILQFCGK